MAGGGAGEPGPGGGGAARELEVRDPRTGEVVARVPRAGEREVRRAVARAREAAARWSRRSVIERGAALGRLRRAIAARAEEVAARIARETGKSEADAVLAEVLVACDHLAWTARRAPRVLAPRRAGGLLAPRGGRVVWEPHGVAGLITPWNFPFLIPASGLAAALAAGNAAVIKPSELTPLSALLLAELTEEAVGEPGLVEVVTGDGETGQALVDAPVDVLAFTGGTATGRAVMAAASRHLTPLVLELGGKDAMIVLDDADLERAARGAVWGAFFHAGQVCQSVERLYVQRSVWDRFLGLLVRETERIRAAGDDPAPDVGPFTRPAQMAIVREQVEEALRGGARALTGGQALPGPGLRWGPTVLVDVDPSMRVMREETFGPVLPVVPFEEDDEAARLAADTAYGLDAYVWTADRRRGRRLARSLAVGSVLFNDCLVNYAMAELPFGGVRASGFGRVHGEEGLRAFARPRAEAEARLRPRREPHWFPGSGARRWALAAVRCKHAPGVRTRLAALAELARHGIFSRSREDDRGEESVR